MRASTKSMLKIIYAVKHKQVIQGTVAKLIDIMCNERPLDIFNNLIWMTPFRKEDDEYGE